MARDELNDAASGGFDQGRRDRRTGAGEKCTAAEQGNAGDDSAPAEAIAKLFAASCLAALDRADGPAQMPCRLLVAASFEIAEHNGCPIMLGELFDLGVKETIEIIVLHGVCLQPLRGRPLFVLSTTCSGQAVRDAVR